MLSPPSYFMQQSRERLEGVPPVAAEQRGGKRRGRGCPHSRLPHSSPFYGDIALLSVFAIIFVASHCSTHVRNDHAAWWNSQRRLASEQQRGGGIRTGTGDSLTCEWLKDTNGGSFTLLSSEPSSTPVAPGGIDVRPSGHGFKKMWEVASEEDLQAHTKVPEKAGSAVNLEGAALEEGLSPPLERLIEEALAEGSSLQLAPWLVDPGLEVPVDLAFEGEQGGGMITPQESPEARTIRSEANLILATTAVFLPPAPDGAAIADAVKQAPQQAAGAPPVDRLRPPSSTSNPKDSGIFGGWSKNVDSYESLIEQADQAGITGPMEGQYSHISGPKESGLQVDYSYTGKAQPSLCSPHLENFLPTAAPVSGEDLSMHPFYRTPPLCPGVVPREFNMHSAFARGGAVFTPLRALVQISSWLRLDFLDALGANALMRSVEELAGFAMHNVKGNLKFLRPVFGVETLAVYLLVVDSLYAASITLGDSARRNIWWGKIMAGLPASSVVKSQQSHRKATKRLLALAGRIGDSLEIFRSGSRPSPQILVPLKQEILCSGVLRKFHKGGWKFFKHHDDEWKAYMQTRS